VSVIVLRDSYVVKPGGLGTDALVDITGRAGRAYKDIVFSECFYYRTGFSV
jgi:hypothetical protein